MYVLFESGALPPAHLLYFCVAVSGEGKGVCPSAAQGVGINAVYWDSFHFWVVECQCCHLQGVGHVLCGHLVFHGVHEIGREGGSLGCTMFLSV